MPDDVWRNVWMHSVVAVELFRISYCRHSSLSKNEKPNLFCGLNLQSATPSFLSPCISTVADRDRGKVRLMVCREAGRGRLQEQPDSESAGVMGISCVANLDFTNMSPNRDQQLNCILRYILMQMHYACVISQIYVTCNRHLWNLFSGVLTIIYFETVTHVFEEACS